MYARVCACNHVCACVHLGHDSHEGQGQVVRAASLLLPYGYQRLNSGSQVWQQAPLPIRPSCQPSA